MSSLKEIEVLGSPAVYPGHPLTIAFMITHVFDSLDEAKKEAPGCGDIPGAGGNVYFALSLLDYLKNGTISDKEFFERADRSWDTCDDQKERYPERWIKGQEQADMFKLVLRARLGEWDRR